MATFQEQACTRSATSSVHRVSYFCHHRRDVVVAVSKARWFWCSSSWVRAGAGDRAQLIDEHIGDHYGSHIVIPNKYEGMDSLKLRMSSLKTLRSMVPQSYLDFRKILADHGVPVEHADDSLQAARLTEATATPLVDAALKHPKMMIPPTRLAPPADMTANIHDSGRKVAALRLQARKHGCGRRHQYRPGRRGRRAL